MRSTAVLFLLASAASGQRFEVASVKVHEGPMTFGGVRTEGARLESITGLRGLVLWAYGLRNFQIAGELEDSTFYDVQAKAPGDRIPTAEEFRAMLRNLLADRYKLKAHMESREVPVYELVVGKSGPKLKPGDAESTEPPRVSVEGRVYELSMPNAKMAEFLQMLDNSGLLGRPALDHTGLDGSYKIRFRYTPGFQKDDPESINIFAAVQSQLGLKLTPGKGMLDVLVVDHVEKPSGN
ncbi:MAG TPA: TIGR03435 family protein [Candidatus Limnocylindrales bacterium]|nr:TIGR03435 family protein [Candidatus Limnocylindrales bacterium]